MPTELRQTPRDWRTRHDDFEEVWESKIVPELEADDDAVFDATFLFEYLQDELPGHFPESKLRTFQRRVRDYRALKGPSKEVMFAQVHQPGRKAQLDFTRLKELGVTIRGELLDKLLFECILCYSGRRHVQLVPSESYEALACGTQGAFVAWNGVPWELWHDHMSAAIHNLKSEERYEINQIYKERLAHFGVTPRFIEVAKPNQNGMVERGHRTLKNIIRQALKLRHGANFDSEGAFWAFLQPLIERLNRKQPERWELDRKALKPLPASLLPDYSELRLSVSSGSLISVKNNTYSVPSRLIGHDVTVRLHLDRLEVFYKDKLAETLPRQSGRGYAVVNYRHIIESLVRKPGAFADYRYRESLFPSLIFRETYDSLRASNPDKADADYVRILHLAARTMECEVEQALGLYLESKKPFGYDQVAELLSATPRAPICPPTSEQDVDLKQFDSLLTEDLRGQLCAA